MPCHSAHAVGSLLSVASTSCPYMQGSHTGEHILSHLLEIGGYDKDDKFGIKMLDLLRAAVNYDDNKCAHRPMAALLFILCFSLFKKALCWNHIPQILNYNLALCYRSYQLA